MDEVEVESKPGTYPNLDDILVEDDEPTLLLPCITCNKTFKPEALQRHSKVCERNAHKKRKTFDSFKQRVQGTELAEFLPFSTLQKKVPVSDKPASPKKASSHWKENHEAFVSAIRAARGEGSDATGGSGEPRSLLRPPGHEQCPYCERHFGPKAFDRHQEWCREQHSRQPQITASSQAKERLEARTKYRAPPMKSKRAITREKYSPLVQRKVRQGSPSSNAHNNSSITGSATSSAGSVRHTSQSQLEQSNRLSRSGNSLSGRSQIKESTSQLGFNRGLAGRTSLRASQRAIQRSNSPGKQSPGSGKAQPQHKLPSYEESRGIDNYDRESMLLAPSNAKKPQTRSQTSKQLDGKALDYQKTKPLRQNSLSSISMPNSQTLQIEVKANELKESNNNNHNKNLKNDHIWRQGHHDRHSILHFPPSNSLFPDIVLDGPARRLSKDSRKERKFPSNSKNNSFELNNLVTEMLVLPFGSYKTCSNRPGNKELCNHPSDESVSVVKERILSFDYHDESEIDVMNLNKTASPVVQDISSDNVLDLGFDSYKGTPVSSSHSADSNRTYTTQSFSCSEMDTESGQDPITESKAGSSYVSKLGSSVKESQSENAISTVCENTRQKNWRGSQITGSISKIVKRSLRQEQIVASSKRNRGSLRNRVKTIYPPKLEKTNFSSGTSKVASLCPLDSYKKPSVGFCIPIEVDNLTLGKDSYLIETKPEEAHGQLQRQKTSVIKEDLTVKNGCIDATHTTWNEIAINGCQASQFFVLHTYSKFGDMPTSTLPFNSDTRIPKLFVKEQIENVKPLKKQFLKLVQLNQCPQGRSVSHTSRELDQDILFTMRPEDSRHSCHPVSCGENLSGLTTTDASAVQMYGEEKLPNAVTELSTQSGAQYHSKYISAEDDCICLFRQGEIQHKRKHTYGIQKISSLNGQDPIEHCDIRIFKCGIPILPIQVKLSVPLYISKNLNSIRLQPLPFILSLSQSGKRPDEPYDPYASAERQMMELLRSDSAANINCTPKCKTQESQSPAPSLSPMPSPTLSPKPSPLETSPTSAFTRYAKESEFAHEVITETEIGSTEKLETTVNSKINNVVETLPQYFSASDSSASISELNEPCVNLQLQPNPLLHQSKPAVMPPDPPGPQPQPQTQPLPPPRSYKRLASLQNSNNLDLVVCGSSAPRPQLQTSYSLDVVLKDLDDAERLENRPKTYDLSNCHMKDSKGEDGGSYGSDEPAGMASECPAISDNPDCGKVEILNLENREYKKGRRETRESREIREITERESGISDIDNLLEEVVRMQRSVSMFSEVDSSEVKDASPMITPQTSTSARSRRNRAGKMHIEDFLFPAESIERENNNFKSSGHSSEQSRSVFGSTKSRKSSSKGRRLIEDMLFPPGIDFNANSDNYNEDRDVVVSANALSDACSSSGNYNSKRDPYNSHFPTSPVTLTSKVSNNINDSDGFPRPKPVSLSTHSSAGNGFNEVSGREPTSISTSPMQHQNHSRQSNSSRLSGDSAYSSLNRKSPVPHVRRQSSNGPQDTHRHGAESPQSVLSQSLTQSLLLSSSGSESSLPPLTNFQSSKHGSRSKHECDTPSSDIVSATTPLLPKLSKFCHQCGTKFLIPVAKFCHECGAPRLEIC